MQERELIKIKSDNPAHPQGFYWQFKDCMKSGDEPYEEGQETKAETKKKVKK